MAEGAIHGAGISGHAAAAPTAAASSERPATRDPMVPVLELGDRSAQVGATIGLVLALAMHGSLAVRAMTSLWEMLRVAQEMRAQLHEFFWTHYEIEPLEPPKMEAPPPPPPEPEPAPLEPEPAPPEPAPKAVAPPPPKDDPYDTPPPPPAAAPAQAQKILTAPEDPDQPVDMTDKGFVSGDGTGPGYGQVSAQGTATAPTWAPNAKVGGVPGGTGTGTAPAAPPPPEVDKSRPPTLLGGTSWNCPFPPEADTDQIDQAVATIVVTVQPDGTPQSVKVTSDPGHGFGRQARICALGRRYSPGLDKAGNPTTATTPPIKVRFTR